MLAGSENSSLISHYWVASYPFFESALIAAGAPGAGVSLIRLYDSDGALINEIELDSGQEDVAVLELEQFMGACKLESGMKHAHLEVKSPPGRRHYCRLHTHEGACILGEPAPVSCRHSSFFPLVFADDRTAFMVMVNHSAQASSLRVRLYLGKRAPEIQIAVPPMGSRVLSVPAEFGQVSGSEGCRGVPGFLRISSMAETGCGVQLVELVNSEHGKTPVYSSVS